MNPHVVNERQFDLRASVCCYDEQGHEILKEETTLRVPFYLQQFSVFKHFVCEYVGLESILDEIGFQDYDVLFYRTKNNGRFAIRTQQQFSIERLKFISDTVYKTDQLEIMICKKVRAWVKGRPGSILIVPTESGGSHIQRNTGTVNPVYFLQEEAVNEPPTHAHSPVMSPSPAPAMSTEQNLQIMASSGYTGYNMNVRRRKKDPRKEEDSHLFEKIRVTDFVERNERQQAVFDELTSLLSELSGSVPVSEGKFLCGICKKERLVCPNRNNVGRVRYFRRKHYDKCLATGGKGFYRGSRFRLDLPFQVDVTDDDSRNIPDAITSGGSSSPNSTPHNHTAVNIKNVSVELGAREDPEIMFIKQENSNS